MCTGLHVTTTKHIYQNTGKTWKHGIGN